MKANLLQMRNLEAAHVSANVRLDTGKLQITELTSDFIGGKHRGEWQADFSVKPAVCKGSGSVAGASLAADAMNDGWIEGVVNANYQVKGPCPANFWTSAEGMLHFEMRDGNLPHLVLDDGGDALKVNLFVGQARLHAGKIEMKDANLDSPEGKFRLTGVATLKGELDFKLERNPKTAAAYTITGTIESPQVNFSSGSETQARLKPEPSK
jgi:hypothetical protein